MATQGVPTAYYSGTPLGTRAQVAQCTSTTAHFRFVSSPSVSRRSSICSVNLRQAQLYDSCDHHCPAAQAQLYVV